MEKAKGTGPPNPDFSREHGSDFSLPVMTTKDVEFSWTPMANAVAVPATNLEKTPYFSSTLVDKESDTQRRMVTVTSTGRRGILLAGPVL